MNRRNPVVDRRTVLKTAAITGVGLTGVATVPGGTVAQSCDTTVSPGDDITTAITNASAGDTICLDPGTYNQNVVVDTSVTIVGAGSGSNSSQSSILDGSAGNGLDMQADDITVEGLRITGCSNGIRFGQSISNTVLRDLVVTDNSPRCIEVRNPVELENLTLDNVELSDSEDGFRVSTDGSITGLTITNSAIDNNDIGLEVYTANTEPSSGNLSDVTIENTTFNGNSKKGIYTETLSDAELDNLTIENSGTNSEYGFNAGIDINLKYGDYSDITISNTTVTGVTEGSPPNDRFPVGITVKARQDGSTYGGNPATVDNVSLESLTVEDTPNGIRFGEPGKSAYGLQNASIHDSDIEDNDNFGLINEVPIEVDATDNWWGHASGPGGPDGRRNPAGKEVGNGDDIVGDIAFDPWLRKSNGNPSR